MTLSLEHLTPRDSPLARFDPRWKLAALVLAILAFAALRTLAASAVAFGTALTLARVGRLPRQWVRARLLLVGVALVPFLIILPLTVEGPTTWEWGGLRFSAAGVVAAVALILKTLAIVTLALVLVGTAPLHVTLLAAQRLRVPGLLVQILLMSYRYVFVLADEFDRIRTALRVRGFRNRANRHSYQTIGRVAGTLLVRGAERAERVAQAMRCRGFDGRFRSLTEFRSRWPDGLAFAGIVAAALALVVWDTWA